WDSREKKVWEMLLLTPVGNRRRNICYHRAEEVSWQQTLSHDRPSGVAAMQRKQPPKE
ncbi:hypothetical protein RUM43_012714, partial [Polyplax serrata]